MLRAIRVAFHRESSQGGDKRGYYSLQLNYQEQSLTKWYFKPSEIEEAASMYENLEQEKGNKPLDTVLIRASSFSAVKAAYPNYFLDIGEFVDLVANYLRS